MTARIVMDAGGGPVIGSITLPGSQVNTPVLLSNSDNTDVEGWRWELLDAPAPSATYNPLPPPTHSNTEQITPDVKGHTIMVRLTTYKDAGRTQIDDVDQQVIRVRFDPPFDWVIPAAQESIEANELRGWAADVNRILREVHVFMDEGGAGGFMLAKIPGGEEKVINPNLSMLWTPDVEAEAGGDLEVEGGGDMAGVSHRENHNPEYIPVRQTRTVYTQDTLLVDRIRIRGRLRLLGRLRILPTIDGQYVLDQLTEVAPDAGGILGALSPARFLDPGEVRGFTDTLTAAQVQQVADAAVANVQDLPMSAQVYGSGTGGQFPFPPPKNTFLRFDSGMNGGLALRLAVSQGGVQVGDRIGVVNVDGSEPQWGMDGNTGEAYLGFFDGNETSGSTKNMQLSRFGSLIWKYIGPDGTGNPVWVPCGGSDFWKFALPFPSFSQSYVMEYQGNYSHPVPIIAGSYSVRVAQVNGQGQAVSLSNYSLLVRNASSITQASLGTYSVLGRASTGNIGPISLSSSNSVLGRSTGSLGAFSLSSDAVLGRSDTGSLAQQRTYNLRHILGGRTLGGDSINAANITSAQGSWQPGGATIARRAWFHRMADTTGGQVNGLYVSAFSSDQVFEKYFHNTDPVSSLPWAHESGSAGSTSYRILCPGNTTYFQKPGELVKLVYDWSNSRWVLQAGVAGAGFTGSNSILRTDGGGNVGEPTILVNSLVYRGAGTIAGLPVGEQRLVGRITGNALGALTGDHARGIVLTGGVIGNDPAGTYNNYNPDGFAFNLHNFLQVTGVGDLVVNTLIYNGVRGDLKFLTNAEASGANDIVLKHSNGGSGEIFSPTGQDYRVHAGETVALIRNTTFTRWHIIGKVQTPAEIQTGAGQDWVAKVTGAGPHVLTAARRNRYDDSGAASMVLHLPVASADGEEVEVKEVGGSTNAVTITTALGTTNIETVAAGASATTDTLNAAAANVRYKWDATDSIWRIIKKVFI